MKLTLVSKVKEFKAKDDDGEPVGTLTVQGLMSPSEIGQLARFLGKTIIVSLVLQQPGLFDDEPDDDGQQQMSFDEAQDDEAPKHPTRSEAEPDRRCQRAAAYAIRWKRQAESESGVSPEGTMFACEEHMEQMLARASEKAAGGPLEVVGLAALEDASNRCSYVEESKVDPWPFEPCGKPAGFRATIDDGDGPVTKLLCGEHLKEFDQERQAEVEPAPEGSVCEFLIHPASQIPAEDVCRCGHHQEEHFQDNPDDEDSPAPCHAEGCDCQEFVAQDAEFLAMHTRMIDTIGEICGDCPAAELCVPKGECDRLKAALDNPEADAQSEVDQHERHMAEAAEEMAAEFQGAASNAG